MSQLIEENIRNLTDLLSQERQLLLAGKAGETAALAEGKLEAIHSLEQAFGSLQPDDVPASYRPGIAGIVRLARENSIHFDAIRNGVRRVIDRLETLNSGAYVGSYTEKGDKVAFSGATGRFLKKA